MSWFGGGNSSGLPSGLPNRWPNHDEEDLKLLPWRSVSVGKRQSYHYKDNFVKTSKYTFYLGVWDFLPKFLLEEFNPRTKIANCYFLMIAMLQMVPKISNTGGIPTTFAPLAAVVFVDGFFQVIEDLGRHKADKVSNSSKAIRYEPSSNRWIPTAWHMIEVGDYIKVHSREQIPADMIILCTAEETGMPARGQCYVETKQLDGETNLKLRLAMPNTMANVRDDNDLKNLKGAIQMEHPNNLIDAFEGSFNTTDFGKEACQPTNVLLRGCVLRNTDWVIGVVVNAGHDTKIMMTSKETKEKNSMMSTIVSSQIIKIVGLLSLVCICGATGATIFNNSDDVNGIWQFHRHVLLLLFAPRHFHSCLSLSFFMTKDEEMYYDAIDAPAQVRTMTLNEELGQISHIFSDKTGTLTCNVMDFRKFSVNGRVYGQGITEIGKASWKLQGREIPISVLEDVMEAGDSNPEYEHVQRFFRTLAICHDVIAEKVDGQIKLSASNPDDEALVCAAEYFGFKFTDRRDKFMLVQTRESGGEVEELELLESIEFSSKRKRMSVIVRETDGKIRLYIKGADTVINERLRKGQASIVESTNRDMASFSDEGLRCLLVGYAELTEDHYTKWHKKYKAAKTDLGEVEKKKKMLPNMIEELEEEIEKDIILIGSTALEDRLQDGVPEAVALLAKANIKIWVLTGDKEETAINIAVACNLVLPELYMKHLFDKESAHLTLATSNKAMLMTEANLCQELRQKLLAFSQRCKAVVGCRVSPDQKREMVDMIKTGVEGVRSLAVGDGANDVAMIQEAHVGVGIKGEEGLQAVNSSDFAIAQFRFLAPLILKHGQKYYNEFSIQAFNVIYTFFPIIAFGAYDKDITATSCKLFPQDYQECVKNLHFSDSKFWFWLVTAILESILVSVLPLYLLYDTGPGGSSYSFWAAGTMCYTCVVVIVNAKLMFIQNRWHWFSFFLMFGSMFSWLLTSLLYSSWPTMSIIYTYTGIVQTLLNDSAYWCGWIIICTLILGKDIYFCALERTFNYRNYHIIQEYEKNHDFASQEIVEALQRKVANAKQDSDTLDGEEGAVSPTGLDLEDASHSPLKSSNSRSPRQVGAVEMR
eukprot:GSChrysophyteH2.ASY1.ANO1.183.1 assembled CDS